MTGPGIIMSAGGLIPEEMDTLKKLVRKLEAKRFRLQLINAYYEGTFRVLDLGISIPPSLRNLHTTMGWPRIAVDSVEERLDVEGFRFPGASDADTDLWDIWQTNNLDEESPLAHIDALVYGHAFVAVGANEDPTKPPLITIESPLDMECDYDVQSRTITSALRTYNPGEIWGIQAINGATLYLPDSTTHLTVDGQGVWTVVNRDDHRLGQVPVVRMVNRQRSADRVGRSEITPEIMSITDAACRTLLGLQVASEFYSAPQRAILGASEESFQNADGTPKNAWETYLGRVLALERDGEGNVPTIHEMKAYDPSVYTKVYSMYAKIMASLIGLPSHYIDDVTAQPASADAIRSGESRLVRRIGRKMQSFSGAWENVMRLALLIRDGSVDDDANKLETVWHEAGVPTIAETTDAIVKQIQVGSIPSSSDVTLEKLGYTPAERERLVIDRQQDQGAQLLAELATSILSKEARVDRTIASDINPQAAKEAPVVDPNTGLATVKPTTASPGTSAPKPGRGRR